MLQITSSTGGIKDSALYREYPSKVYCHGQYEDISHQTRIKSLPKNRVFYMDPADVSDAEAFDDFYSPIEPEGYIRHRVLPQLQFYQNRCSARVHECLALIADDHYAAGCPNRRPSTSRRRLHCSQRLQVRFIIPASFTSQPSTPAASAASVLSFLSLTNYVGIVTVVASSLSAFIEYTAAPQKLGRYNASVLALNVSLNWWASLSDIMKKDRKNVSKLMADCERAYVTRGSTAAVRLILTWYVQDLNGS